MRWLWYLGYDLNPPVFACKVYNRIETMSLCVQEILQMIKDAHTICESDNATLLKDLTALQRPAAMEQIPNLRSQCLQLTCAALSWPEFNSAPPEGTVKPEDESAAGQSPAPTPSSPSGPRSVSLLWQEKLLAGGFFRAHLEH